MKDHRQLLTGTPWKVIMKFSIPILIGNMFQMLYNLVDMKIVGSTLGEQALSAMGAVSPLFSLYVLFIGGFTQGLSVILSMEFGRDHEQGIKAAYASSILIGFVTSILITILSVVSLPWCLRFLKVPEDQMFQADYYVRIILLGLIVTCAYNLFANMLRAIGNSVTPLIFLVIATICNIILDYTFILGLGMGVEGAAYATVLAQAIAAVLCYLYIVNKVPLFHIKKEHFRIDRELYVRLFGQGLGISMMSCVISIGTVILQTAVNSLGPAIIVAHTAARKVLELFIQVPVVTGTAITTYCGQNLGAGNHKRIRSGVTSVIIMSIIWGLFTGLMCHIFAEPFISFLASTKNPEIIYWGSRYMLYEMAVFVLCTVLIQFRSILQGLERPSVPVFTSIVELAGKVIFTFLLIPKMGYWGVIVTEPITWIIMLIPMGVLIRKMVYCK